MIEEAHHFSFHTLMTRRIKNHEPNIPWYVQDKVVGPEFFRRTGCRTPQVYEILDSPEAIDLSRYPDKFVIKPSMLSSNIAVRVLERQGERYYDQLRSELLTTQQVIEEQSSKFYESERVDKFIIVEEWLEDESPDYAIPRDFKFYGSQGRLQLILEMDRNNKSRSAAWYDGDFEPILDDRVVNETSRIANKSHDRPRQWRAMLATAKRLNVAVPTPFCSVDLYPTQGGPVVGEVTLCPGGLYYDKDFHLSEETQLRLALGWVEAERELSGSNFVAAWTSRQK